MDTVVVHEEGASVAVGYGEAGYLIIHEDGLDFRDETYVKTWAWRVLNEYGRELGEGNDLTSNQYSLPLTVVGSLVSFLLACAESKTEDSENYNLFTQTVREWAEMYSDELQAAALEIEEAEEV